MNLTESYKIMGGNYERAGLASRRLKERLKKLGIEPAILRRIMIAAYEAEMNVVIHASKGDMWVTLDNHHVYIEVRDQGPGIPDIEQAMTLGFSTASEEAKTLGFGAGMGLPNIKKHSDLFEIESTPGQGTRLTATIFLKNQEAGLLIPHSLQIAADLCCGCLQCLHTCPTKAIRVRDDQPHILEYLCIDCTACIAVCETGALTMQNTETAQVSIQDSTLVIPSSFLVQFIPEATPKKVLALLEQLGFRPIRFIEGWEMALREAIVAFANEIPETRPLISPVCPAVVNLIEMRFPTLLDNVARFLSPIEAAYEELHDEQIVFVPACPSQQTALVRKGLSDIVRSMPPSQLFQAVLPLLGSRNEPQEQWPPLPGSGIGNEKALDNVLQVSGIRNVINILEKTENGLLNDVPVLELFICDQGCFGSPLLKEGPFIARYRWLHSFMKYNSAARAIRRQVPLLPRAGLRLSEDMSEAIRRLSEIDRITRELPGKNCGMCGAPTCGALAEDIVMERATKTMCIYL